MARIKDLTGSKYGDLLVIKQAPYIYYGGQKKVAWECLCICGNTCIIAAQNLTTGKTKSCGCRAKRKGAERQNRRKCVICGSLFAVPPSNETVTCSKECSRQYHRLIRLGRPRSEATKKKMSASAKGRDMSDLQSIATEAAKQSPNSGRFTTNVNAKDWHLISPDGVHYSFRSLSYWLRHDGAKFFGIDDPNGKNFVNARSGLANAKRGMLGKIPTCTYKDWRIVIDD